jgi:hypothetical protein
LRAHLGVLVRFVWLPIVWLGSGGEATRLRWTGFRITNALRARSVARLHAASQRLAFALEDSVLGIGWMTCTVTVDGNGLCAATCHACMHRLLWVGSEIHTRESRSLVAATTARLPIDTLRAQSPPNTGSTIGCGQGCGLRLAHVPLRPLIVRRWSPGIFRLFAIGELVGCKPCAILAASWWVSGDGQWMANVETRRND